MRKIRLRKTGEFKKEVDFNKELFKKHYDYILDLMMCYAPQHYSRHTPLLKDENGNYSAEFDNGYMKTKMTYIPIRDGISDIQKYRNKLEGVKLPDPEKMNLYVKVFANKGQDKDRLIASLESLESLVKSLKRTIHEKA